ncbi:MULTISPECIES: 3-hydroxybutyryl-CoA dehydrogenase [unclassified Brevibacterium]|uniref:3-hydroxybutyryl-CoA dehydrogenase n=1 Tax=unclassified Brevibacterium TaxID=2614124 RepID=UPI0008A2392B|nr:MULTISPECIES: 3-hydroxybutyryl-CoA dehydrogenase [unclassified Brevibacterium]OFL64214.1 3-hydroxybutyryl-CoA dehydrogenase [Brevibacterium sp. HMSC063G07]OFS26378.1 3-hydroxybutyryl-CoA dehydrogenase [Brevibacterium sp. HMSC07C04]
MEITKAGVIGSGLMGSGIAEVLARSGLDVVVRDISDEAVAAGRGRIEKSFAKGVERGKLSQEDADAALGRLTFTTDLQAMADRQLVIEAASENEDIKKSIFAELDDIVTDKNAILASNTSSMPIIRFAQVTSRPERVLGLHFFNPAPVQPLVEIISSVLTDPEVANTVEAFAVDVLDKKPIRSDDRPGFIVNALLIPYLFAAIRMYEAGHATKEDIDNGMMNGAAHPMGPLTLADLIGLDTCLFVGQSIYEETGAAADKPPVLLSRMVDGGLLGRKSGRGFYDYR